MVTCGFNLTLGSQLIHPFLPVQSCLGGYLTELEEDGTGSPCSGLSASPSGQR